MSTLAAAEASRRHRRLPHGSAFLPIPAAASARVRGRTHRPRMATWSPRGTTLEVAKSPSTKGAAMVPGGEHSRRPHRRLGSSSGCGTRSTG
jgi:hypothetical protein